MVSEQEQWELFIYQKKAQQIMKNLNFRGITENT